MTVRNSGVAERARYGRGFFISFEGIDGAGKSTHIEPLAEALRARGAEVVVTREPGGTPLAERLRALVLAEPMDTLSEVLLVFAARREHLLQVIAPALERGAVVLCDRYTDATFAYQGAGRGIGVEILQHLEQWVQHLPGQPEGQVLEPDLTLWFDLAPVEAARRLAQARRPDRFEAETLAFFERVRAGYDQRQRNAPERIRRIDAAQPLPAVAQRVHAIVMAALASAFNDRAQRLALATSAPASGTGAVNIMPKAQR